VSAKGILAPLALAFLLSSCGGDDDPSGPNGDPQGTLGTFSATFTGDIAATTSGSAIFASIQGEGFGLSFTSSTQSATFTIARNTSGRPGQGSVNIGDGSEGDVQGVLYVGGVINNVTFVSTSGTLTITSSSASRLQGTFSFQAATGASGTTTVTGSFNAVCTAVVVGYCD